MNELVDGPVTVHVGDALSVLRQLPSESVHMCVTSPPYWGLRDYGATGQLGLEPTPELYVEHLVEVFREVRRVLRRDGSCWLNLGDSYAATGKSGGGDQGQRWSDHGADYTGPNGGKWRPAPPGLKPKDLVGIPWMVAFALRADGWWLRSEITWCKRAPMPESVEDRPTSATEKVFLLTKVETYFYDHEAVKESAVGQNHHDLTGNGYAAPGQSPARGNRSTLIVSDERKALHGPTYERHRSTVPGGQDLRSDPTAYRNMRNYWLLGPEPFPEAHFAVFVSEVPMRVIKAGTSEHGVCPECGAPWIYGSWNSRLERWESRQCIGVPIREGWQPTCPHEAPPVPATVLDPFAGSGTTLAVARRLGRRAVGIELQADYLPLIRKRVEAGSLPLLELIK